MTIETTNDPEQYQRFVANVAGKLLPNPDVPLREKWAVTDEEENRWLTELLQRLDIRQDDVSEPAQAKVFEHLAKRMAISVLRGKDPEQIKNRLGERGILRSDAYRISFDEYFDEMSPWVAVRHSHVEDAIRSPDAVQHFFSDKLPDEDESLFLSLFLKTHRQKDAFSLLVITSRRGAELKVQAGFRVYHREIRGNYKDPVELLTGFVDRYGIDFTVPEDPTPHKLLLNEVRLLKGNSPQQKRNISVRHHDRPWAANIVIRVSKLNVMIIPIAFVTDMIAYQSDLRSHGVSFAPVTMSTRMSGSSVEI